MGGGGGCWSISRIKIDTKFRFNRENILCVVRFIILTLDEPLGWKVVYSELDISGTMQDRKVKFDRRKLNSGVVLPLVYSVLPGSLNFFSENLEHFVKICYSATFFIATIW